jgi:MFS family permease
VSNSVRAQPDDRLVSAPFLTVIAASLFSALAFSSTLPMVARYVSQELGGGDLEVGIAIGVFSVGAVAVRPFIGRLGDERGRRFLILGGTLSTSVVLAMHALANTYALLLLVRLLMGAVQGGFFVGTITLVNDLAPEHRRGEAASYFSISIYGGMAFGPWVGELATERYDFSGGFLVAALLMGLAAAISWFLPAFVPTANESQQYAIDRPPRMNLDDVPPKRGLIYRPALWPGVILATGLITFPAMQGFMPKVMDERSLGDAGPIFASYGVLVLVLRLLARKMPDKLGTAKTAAIALAGASSGMLVMSVLVSRNGFFLGTAVLAIGGSLLYPALMVAAVEGVPPNERAQAMSTFTMFFELSGGVGAPLLGLVAWLAGTTVAAFVAGATFAGLGLPLLWYWQSTKSRAVKSPSISPAPTVFRPTQAD